MICECNLLPSFTIMSLNPEYLTLKPQLIFLICKQKLLKILKKIKMEHSFQKPIKKQLLVKFLYKEIVFIFFKSELFVERNQFVLAFK